MGKLRKNQNRPTDKAFALCGVVFSEAEVCHSTACMNNKNHKCMHGDYDCIAKQT